MNRYFRNIQISQINEEGQKKLSETKVLIAGAGGLGSGVIANLSAIGIGTMGIIDSDFLEVTNLNRQFIHEVKNLGRPKTSSAKKFVNNFNPEVRIVEYNLKLDEENYKDFIKEYDIIIDCFDSLESKFLLNKIAVRTGKTLIHGGVTEFGGQVTVIVPKKTACLNCIFSEEIKNTYLPKGVISPAVNTISSIQSMETVKVILGIGEILENRILFFDGLKMTFKELKSSKNRRCSLCGK